MVNSSQISVGSQTVFLFIDNSKARAERENQGDTPLCLRSVNLPRFFSILGRPRPSFHADVFGGSSRVPASRGGLRDEPKERLRCGEAIPEGLCYTKTYSPLTAGNQLIARQYKILTKRHLTSYN